MPEHNINTELAHHLHEEAEVRSPGTEQNERIDARIEILEAFLLAVVAVATAWSGYQAAVWDGHSASHYALASVQRIDGDNSLALGSEQRLQDASNFDTWLLAKAAGGNQETIALLERRFSDDYEPAFRAWIATDPFSNPNAPPGPAYTAQYRNHLEAEAKDLRNKADESMELGRTTRETGERYVRLTVFLATVLFMVAFSRRFRRRLPQLILLGVSLIAVAITLVLLVTYPRG